MQVGAVLRAEKTVRPAPRLRNFSARKCANSLQILCAVDAQRTKTSASVAAKIFYRCRISASICWRVQCRKRAHPAVEHAQNFAKFCINDARICCKIFTISTHGAANFAVLPTAIQIQNSQDIGAAKMKVGAVLRYCKLELNRPSRK